MDLQQKILVALSFKPLSNEELAAAMGMLDDAKEFKHALYWLQEQEHLILKHPVIGGGCKMCACEVTFKWGLTMSGRQSLKRIY